MVTVLDFEKHAHELEMRLNELRNLANAGEADINEEFAYLKKKTDKQLAAIYAKLTPWQKIQVARHPERPHCSDYIAALIEDFFKLSGDRQFGEDEAIIGGLGRFRGQTVMVLGHEKGRDMETRMRHNFGMAKPEGYRKVKRLMKLADHFQVPIITFVDTAGAYPGVEAEERGQSEAIASCILTQSQVNVPVISVVTGEGGSGGAVALAVANSLLMLEHSVYSVISPEGCASILWRTADKKNQAADALKLTAQDLLRLGVIDKIITEPVGGAHRDPSSAIKKVGEAIAQELARLQRQTKEQCKKQRQDKFLAMGRNL